MDTRIGTGVRKGVVNGGSSVSLPVAGKNGVPATGVSAAVFNVTVTGDNVQLFATVYPGGTTRPGTSNLNFPKGFTGANLVTVPLGSDGTVRFYNNAGLGALRRRPRRLLRRRSRRSPVRRERLLHDDRTGSSTPAATGASGWNSQEYFPLSLTFGADVDPRIRGFVFTLTAGHRDSSAASCR